MGRGDRLDGETGAGGVGGGGGEPTVEALLRTLASLPAGASAVEALGPAIGRLDSRAAAALLKEAAKTGQSARAVELFDWLRGQPEGSALAKLCNVFTYTTMIRQAPLRVAPQSIPTRVRRTILCCF